MNSIERVMIAFSGKKPDRVPVIPFVSDWTTTQMRFTFKEALEDIEKFVFSQYYCAKEIKYDAVQDIGGISAESEAMGSKIEFDKDGTPSIVENAIKKYDEDLQKLQVLNPYGNNFLNRNIKIIQHLKELCKGKLIIDAYLQAPFRHATMLRGNDIYKDILRNKSKVYELLDMTLYSQIVYGTALIHAGADIISISDPTSSGDIISKDQWLSFGHPYIKRLVKFLKKNKIKIYLHICGDTSDRLDTFLDLGIDAISLDQKVDLEFARKKLGDNFPIIGNVSPTNLLLSNSEEVKEESLMCIEKAGKNGSFILAPGCGIGKNTPVKNIKAMVNVAINYYY